MTRLLKFSGVLSFILGFSSLCFAADTPTLPRTDSNTVTDSPKAVVIYFSHSGNTRALAKIIQNLTKADLCEITCDSPYPTDYQATVSRAKKEIQAKHLPAIHTTIDNFDQYSLIFIGTPNWWSTMAPPVATFLSKHSFEGKTVVPFVTHGGGGLARCASDMVPYLPKAKVEDPIAISGSRARQAQPNVESYLRAKKLIQ